MTYAHCYKYATFEKKKKKGLLFLKTENTEHDKALKQLKLSCTPDGNGNGYNYFGKSSSSNY